MVVSQLKAGAALSYIIIIVNIFIGVLYTPFMLRTMGQSEYGLYSLAASLIAYLTVLDLGFGNAIIRYTAKFRAEGKLQEQYEMFGMFFRLYIGIGVLALMVGLALMFNVNNLFGATMNGEELDKMRIIMMLMSFNLAFTFPLSIFGSIISAYENFVFQKVVNIFRITLNPLVMIVLLLMGYKAIALVIVTTLFNLTTLLINWWYCYNKLHIKIAYSKFKWDFFKEISIYSFWIFLNAIMDKIYWSSGQFILGMYKGTLVVAVYAVAIQLQQLYMMFSSAIAGVFLPKVTAMVTRENNDKELSDLFIRTGRIQYIIMAFILTGFILLGKSFIALWAGDGYGDAYTIALLFFVPLTIPLIQNLGITILQARNKMRFRSTVYVIIAIISLVLSITLAPKYGGIGCAVATASALVAGQIITMNIYYHKRVGLDIIRFWKEIGKMSIVPIITLIIGYLIIKRIEIKTIASFIQAALCFSLFYIPLFWVFALNQYEKNLLSAPIKAIFKTIKQR